jgi:hypothetical protein
VKTTINFMVPLKVVNFLTLSRRTLLYGVNCLIRTLDSNVSCLLHCKEKKKYIYIYWFVLPKCTVS